MAANLVSALQHVWSLDASSGKQQAHDQLEALILQQSAKGLEQVANIVASASCESEQVGRSHMTRYTTNLLRIQMCLALTMLCPPQSFGAGTARFVGLLLHGMRRSRRYQLLACVSESLAPQLLSVLSQHPSHVEIIVPLLENLCLGYQHSPHLFIAIAPALLACLKQLEGQEKNGAPLLLVHLIQCLLHVHYRLPNLATFEPLKRLVRLFRLFLLHHCP
jgi:hypothetical protein